MKKQTILLLYLIFLFQNPSNGLEWAKTGSVIGNDVCEIAGMLTSSTGDTYIGLNFSGELVLGENTLVANGSMKYSDLVLIKLNKKGETDWYYHFPEESNIGTILSIAENENDQIYVTVAFRDSLISLENFNVNISKNTGCALLKFTNEGDIVEIIKLWEHPSLDTPNSGYISLSRNFWHTTIKNNIYYAFLSILPDNIGSNKDTIVNEDYRKFTLLKYDIINDNLEWYMQGEGDFWVFPHSISVDNSANIFISFSSSETGDFGGVRFFHTGIGRDGHIVKINSEGNILWNKRIYGIAIQEPGYIYSDEAGNVYVHGRTAGYTEFDGYQPDTVDMRGDGFFVSYDSSGSFRWVQLLKSTGPDKRYFPTGITESNGSVYATGVFSDSISFSNGTILNRDQVNKGAGYIDGVIVEFDAEDGNIESVYHISSPEYSYAHFLDSDENAVYLAGLFKESIKFNEHEWVHEGAGYENSFFVFKITGEGVYSTEEIPQFSASKSQLQIYPQPAGSIAHIKFDEGLKENIKIQLFDLYGRSLPIEIIEFSKNSLSLDTIKLAVGMYILKIENGAKMYNTPLMIAR